MSNRNQSNNDIKFNKLTTSTSDQHSKDLNISSFSHSKMLETSQHGARSIIPTDQYLEQIDKKYSELYEAKKREKMNKNRNHHQNQDLTVTQPMNHNTPNKFKQQQQQQQQQRYGEVLNNQQYVPTLQQPIENNNVRSQMMDQSQIPFKSPVLNIPNDVSLSRGVSERGIKN